MSLLRAAVRSNSIRKSNGPQFPRVTPRLLFSTDAEQPPQDSGADQFLQTPEPGLAYGRLFGIHKHTLKTDIINLLKDCKLTMEDVKVEYDRTFMPLSMMLQFRAQDAYSRAFRAIARNGRLYKVERTDRAQWDIVTPYDGKTILIQGIPRNASIDDMVRFLSGYEYDHSSLQMFSRAGPAGGSSPFKMATVRFRSRTDAMNAFITKNRTFCVNNQVSLLVLQ